jgi:hypothetical protein
MLFRPLLAPLFAGFTVGLMLAAAPSCGQVSGCGPTNCKGCCEEGVCILSPNNARVATCGAGGLACAHCGNRACLEFACSGTGAGGGASTGCSKDSCPSGCCSGTSSASVCIATPSATNCGAHGDVCTSCLAGEGCLDGVCRPTDGGVDQVGIACRRDSDCVGLGADHLCKQTTSSGRDIYTDGYCTKRCESDVECPGQSLCLGPQGGYGEDDSVCWAHCTTQTDCRPGYFCYAVGGGDSACWISPLPAFDAGPPADKVGQPCGTDVACQNPPDDGLCLLDTLSDAGPSAFVNGYCTASCEENTHCSIDGGAKCIALGLIGACLHSCAAPLQGQSSCRAGYVCRPIRDTDGGFLADGFCWPRCSNPGSSCGTTGTCQATGYCG